MTRGPRKQPALVVLALIGAAALVVWLARPDEEGRAPVRSAARDPRPGRTTPVVELAPPSSSTATAVVGAASRPAAADTGTDPLVAATEDGGLDVSSLDRFNGTVSIRGVRGLVRDASTRLPIAGAWLTWRYPDPRACERVLGAGAQRGDARTGMVTDAEGRFAVKRLADGDVEVSSTLFAVASGYAVARVQPGLREDVVIDLEPMGTLEVLVREVPPDVPPGFLRVRAGPARTPGDDARELDLAERGRQGGAVVYVAPHLARGEYRVRLHGRDAGAVVVEPGQTARLEVVLPALVDVQGRVTGVDGPAWIRLEHPDGHRYPPSAPLETDQWSGHLSITDGRVSGRVHEGRYVAVLIGQRGTERRLPDLVDVGAGRELVLRGPEVGPPVEVRLRKDGIVIRGGGVALVALDVDVGAEGRDLVNLGDGEGHARPGRYAVFSGSSFAGEVVLPAGPTMIDTSPFEATVRWNVPATLRDDEVIRGRLHVLPEVIARDAVLRRRYEEAVPLRLRCGRASPTASIPLHVPGRYLLTGETDLGPLEVWVDLAPGVEVTVPLGE